MIGKFYLDSTQYAYVFDVKEEDIGNNETYEVAFCLVYNIHSPKELRTIRWPSDFTDDRELVPAESWLCQVYIETLFTNLIEIGW